VYRFDAGSAVCRVHTWREGLLSGFGHDLELAVTRFTIEVDEAARSVVASFDPTSLRVVGASRDGTPAKLSPEDTARVERATAEDVLQAGRYPEIRFTAAGVADEGGGFRAAGRLALHGREGPLVVRVRRDGERYVVEARLHQPAFGIAPYSAMLGALRVKADVDVRVALPVPR
jgi:polyisoprenoid-binding protein YceI